MKILFLCTAHNSLSQRLYVALAEKHTISIEFALSDNVMIEATQLFQPDLVLCPFLTVAVPKQVYEKYLTLIVHPGPPGDAGPSSIDWLLIGDDGSEPDSSRLLKCQSWSDTGRTYWGVTVLQATETFDAGPVWAFEQFLVNIDDPEITKSSLYRGLITRAALAATSAALSRIENLAWKINPSLYLKLTPAYSPCPEYQRLSVTSSRPFQGGLTRVRPLLKAVDRNFDISTDTAKIISRKIRCADSQPGCLSSVLGPKLYLYGGTIQNVLHTSETIPGKIIDCRDGAICFLTSDRKGIWVTHLRRMKRKEDIFLWPKVSAISCLTSLQLSGIKNLNYGMQSLSQGTLECSPNIDFREIRVDLQITNQHKLAYVYFNFYNGAMSTDQCSRLIQTLESVIESDRPSAIILMGSSSFFSNGIHLNVIQTATDPAVETWRNINRINDLVFHLLQELPKKGIVSIAAIRGNCAAGGVALAAACDHVIAGADVVLNPSYRAIGLHGSEYHTISYRGRCGATKAASLLRTMLPMSASNAQSIGLVDHVLHTSGDQLDLAVRHHVSTLLMETQPTWKTDMELTLSALQTARTNELAEMAKDCWSPRAERFHTRRLAFVCKVKATSTPLRFATHRRHIGNSSSLDEEERDDFELVQTFELKTKQVVEEDACRIALQHLMTNIVGVFREAMKNDLRIEANPDMKQTQMMFPCYYQS